MLITLQLGAASRPTLRLALAGLTCINMVLLSRGRWPSLYASGVRYRRERPDRWASADVVRARGFGDCEDLGTWLAAEYRLRGIDAHADVYLTGPTTSHCVVVMPDGTIEDPSKRLGMGRKKRS